MVANVNVRRKLRSITFARITHAGEMPQEPEVPINNRHFSKIQQYQRRKRRKSGYFGVSFVGVSVYNREARRLIEQSQLLRRRARRQQKQLLRLGAVKFAPERVQQRRFQKQREAWPVQKVRPHMTTPAQRQHPAARLLARLAVVDDDQLLGHFAANLTLVIIPPQHGFAFAAELLTVEPLSTRAARTIDRTAATAQKRDLFSEVHSKSASFFRARRRSLSRSSSAALSRGAV